MRENPYTMQYISDWFLTLSEMYEDFDNDDKFIVI